MSENNNELDDLRTSAQELRAKTHMELNDHQYEWQPNTKTETALIVGFFAVVTAGVAWLVKASINEEKRIQQERQARIDAAEEKRREQNEWENDQRAKGRVLYRLMDGRYLAVDSKADQETMLR